MGWRGCGGGNSRTSMCGARRRSLAMDGTVGVWDMKPVLFRSMDRGSAWTGDADDRVKADPARYARDGGGGALVVKPVGLSPAAETVYPDSHAVVPANGTGN